MEIEVAINSKYKELRIKDTNVFLESGLLDENEAKELAMRLIIVAYELLED